MTLVQIHATVLSIHPCSLPTLSPVKCVVVQVTSYYGAIGYACFLGNAAMAACLVRCGCKVFSKGSHDIWSLAATNTSSTAIILEWLCKQPGWEIPSSSTAHECEVAAVLACQNNILSVVKWFVTRLPCFTDPELAEAREQGTCRCKRHRSSDCLT